MFSDKNLTFGPVSLPGPGIVAAGMGLNARELEVAGTDVLRRSLAGRLGSNTGSKGSTGSPKGSTRRSQPKGSGRENDEGDGDRRDRRRSAEWGTFEARWESDV